MGKRSVFDAFAAAAGYYNQSISMADGVFRAQARSELESVNNLIQIRNAEFQQSLAQRSDFDNWETLFEENQEKLQDEVQRNVSIPLAQREAMNMMNNSYAQQKLVLQGNIINGKANWTKVNNEKIVKQYEEIYTGQELINKRQSMYDSERASNLISEEEYQVKSLSNVTNVMHRDYLQLGQNVILGGGSLDDAITQIEQAQLNYSSNIVRSNISSPESLDDGTAVKTDNSLFVDERLVKDKTKEELTLFYNTRVKAIQDQNETKISGDFYTPAVQAVATGNLSAAMDYITNGEVFLLNKKGNNLSPEVRDKYVRWFADLRKSLTDNPDKAKGLAFESMLETQRDAFIRMGKNGDFETLGTAKEAFQKMAYEQVTQKGYQGSKDQFEFEYYTVFDSFIDEAIKIFNMDPTTQSYMKGIKEYEKQLGEKIEKDFPEEAAEIKSYLSSKVYDIVMNTNWDNPNVKEINKTLDNTLNGMYAKNLDILRKNPNGESGFMRRGGQSEESLISQAVEILQQEETAFTDASGREVWLPGVKEGREPAIKAMQAHIAQLTGVDIGQVNMNPEITEKGTDISGNTIFTVGKDHYKFTTTDGKNITLLKKTGSGEWTETENLYQKTKAVKKEIKADIKEIKTTQEQSAKQKEQAGILSNKTDAEKERVFSETLYTGDKTRNQYWRKSAEAEWNSTGKKEFEATLTAAATIANAPAPNGIDQGTWNSMNSEDKKAWFFENPSAYNDWKTRIENLKKNDRKVTGGI